MAIKIQQPGLLTSVQDRGRTGYYHLGIPQGGALDQYSYELANALVGNQGGEAALECTYMGPAFEVLDNTQMAVTGAPVDVLVNGSQQPTWATIDLVAGDIVTFGYLTQGARFYIAFGGGVDVPEVLGSRSTYPLGALGGFKGRKLEAGDEIPVGISHDVQYELASEYHPEFGAEFTYRVTLGLYDHLLDEQGVKNLTEEEWSLTPVADRAGLRFDGPGVSWKPRVQPFGAGSDPSNIVDAGYAVGSIQIPGGSQPIILHRDAVSGGGYAMVATVISADMDAVARAQPGAKVRFETVSVEEAVELRQQARERLRAALASLDT